MNEFSRFDGQNFNYQTESNYAHTATQSLGNYRGRPFITGDGYIAPNLKTEIFNTDQNQWDIAADFPFASYL